MLDARSLLVQFTVRPAREVLTLLDLIKPESDAPRSLWSTKVTLPVPLSSVGIRPYFSPSRYPMLNSQSALNHLELG
jgi:hypothetical protein